MACTGAYATPWQYASAWCVSSVRTGADNSGGVGNAFLTDSQANFLDFGVRASVGMTLYNLTANTSGPIAAVTATTITATGVTWSNGNSYRVVAMTGDESSAAQVYLDITAPDIHAALAASGACSCTLSSWADSLLAKINVIEAAIFHTCPCANPQLTDTQRQIYLEWVNTQLEDIRTGKLELCSGATGSDFPAVDWAEQSMTEFAAAEIIINRMSP